MVQRVFSFFLLILLLSCNTLENVSEPVIKKIYISKNKPQSHNLTTKTNLITEENQLEVITDGSIATISKFGSDLWIGKLGGSLLRYNLYTGDIKKFTDDIYSIKDYSIKKIIQTDSSIIALQSDRVISIDKQTELLKVKQFPVDINRSSDIVVYKNRVYISTLGYGIREYRLDTGKFIDEVTNLKFVSSLHIDNNILYIGSMKYGLYAYDLDNRRLLSRFYYPLELFNKNIVNIEQYNETLWLGSAKQGLIKWNTNNNEIERLYDDETVSSIYISDNNVCIVSFIGTGIYLERNNTAEFESINSQLITNNITAVSIFNNSIILGNIKKGLIRQEISFLND